MSTAAEMSVNLLTRRFLILTVIAVVYEGWGCSCIHKPGQCCPRANALRDKSLLLYGDPGAKTEAAFEALPMETQGRVWKVFIPKTCVGHEDRPPVLLLHELPALGPGVLELAQRLSCHGYYVYVPLLFGGADDDPDNQLVGAWRAIDFMFFRPSWKVGRNSEREITHQLADLCRRCILPRHPADSRLGIIGLCISGNLPLQLLAETPAIPRFVAPIMSQPSLPFPSCNEDQRKSLGVSEDELALIKRRVTDENLEILGFRFELDSISPQERFDRMRREFGVPEIRSGHFIDATLRARDYVTRDHCPATAHAVLTDGYRAWRQGEQEPSGHYAFRELVAFLDAKLKSSKPQPYQKPSYHEGLTTPPPDPCDRFGGTNCLAGK